ncbi:MAG: caspase family protein [Rhizonema sp. PD38]|nr:caspase family protein [Rhizonema sp. PD38]
MANNWAITIGINQYQFFQPLACAQADAEALKDLLAIQGFSPQQCLLMTETSSPLGDRSTYPTKENILLLLEDLAAACWQPEDKLWFFFSGYGVNYNGQDYLMPVEGNSERVQETGIEVRSLFESLQVAALDTVVLLDINRASGTQAETPIGLETIELAQELQMSVILSCQPEQFSYESSEIGHSLFTVALLEAVRSGYSSDLADLERYLSVRTPELCQHHWLPTQNPVAVISPTKEFIYPQLEVQKEQRVEEKLPAIIAAPSVQYSHVATEQSIWETEEDEKKGRRLDAQKDDFPVSPKLPMTGNNFQLKPIANSTPQFWQLFLLWGATTILLICLIAVVFFRNKAGFRVEEILPASLKTTTPETHVAKPLAIVTTTLPTPLEPETPPPAQPISPIIQAKQRAQALSELAKLSLKPTQASDLDSAIATARKIKPGEPLYEEAQQNIVIWSNMILELGTVRAKQRQYAGAIAAAQLIDKDDSLYTKAQESLRQWREQAKQYVSNQTVLDAANALIQPQQASTYNRAIEVAKKVAPDEPGFDDAQKSIDQWSQKILNLANRRANHGEFKAAIETATLVPEGTTAYKQAREATQKWQNK